MRHGRRNYDRGITGLGTGKAQRYFASDFDRLSDRVFDASEIAAVEVEVGVSHGSVQQRGTARAQPGTAMQYWIERRSAKLNYMEKPVSVQPVEKKGKRVSSIAQIICRPGNRLNGLTYKSK
jgi:hypothetical protein